MIITINCGEAPPPPRPRRVFLAEKVELDMAQFGFKFALPAPGASDVAQRELTVTINGGDPPLVRTYPGATLTTDQWIFATGDVISASLIDVDGSNNRSQPSAAYVFTVTDDVAPPAPGELGVAEKVQLG